jgi:hypothetical protein
MGDSCPLPIHFDRPLGHELEAEWLRTAVSPHRNAVKIQCPPTRPPSTGPSILLRAMSVSNGSGPERAEGSSSRAAGHSRKGPTPFHEEGWCRRSLYEPMPTLLNVTNFLDRHFTVRLLPLPMRRQAFSLMN